MLEHIDTSLIDWSRAQFALTAIYHWLFVPLTLGLAVVMGLMETIYYRTGNDFWRRTARFWMKLFGINFAIGVATGLILEFEFGTNWSNYSWFVGDIFGAPLAMEGIVADFMEATLIAVMYFGNLVELATSDELFAHPLHPYTKSLLSAVPYPDPNIESERKRILYNPAQAHDYSKQKPTMRELEKGHFVLCNDEEEERYRKELLEQKSVYAK